MVFGDGSQLKDVTCRCPFQERARAAVQKGIPSINKRQVIPSEECMTVRNFHIRATSLSVHTNWKLKFVCLITPCVGIQPDLIDGASPENLLTGVIPREPNDRGQSFEIGWVVGGLVVSSTSTMVVWFILLIRICLDSGPLYRTLFMNAASWT